MSGRPGGSKRGGGVSRTTGDASTYPSFLKEGGGRGEIYGKAS